MKYFTFLGCLILCFFIRLPVLRSQELQSRQNLLVRDLIKDGFENVGVKQEKEDVYVFYENRAYRWEIDGLSRVLNHAANSFGDTTILHIVPLHHQVPVTVVTTKVGNYKKTLTQQTANDLSDHAIRVELNTDSVSSISKGISLQNKSVKKIALIFLPGFRVQFC